MTLNKFYTAIALIMGLTSSLLLGCDESRNKISEIVNNTPRFLNRQVKVAGEVTQVYELPLGITNLAAYRVNDGTGQIWVISHAGAPLKGDKVGLKGRVGEMGQMDIPVIGNIIGSVIQEQRRIVR